MHNSFSSFISILVLPCLLYSCSSGDSEKQHTTTTPESRPAPAVASVSATPTAALTPASSLNIAVSLKKDSLQLDSVVCFFNASRLMAAVTTNFSLPLTNLPLGKQVLSVRLYYDGGSTEQHSLSITLLAEEAPQKYSFRKLNTFTHDPDAYTQGLLYHEGFLYESTGTRGESNLRKTEIASGKVLQQKPLESQYFGEGLALWNNSLIQLTWTSNIGFVYDLETFEQTRTFNYPTEGWGLASTEKELVMSDGTEYLYFLDPVTLAETRRIQVYNHEEKILYLNELEVIDGLIYANVYQTDVIIMIDPATGAVVGEVSLEGIFNKQGYNRRLDVLNGIAWDEKGQRLFVTGKWWPRLYQIELFKIQS